MLKIVCISDTHGLHESMPDLPEGDIIVHAGDFSNVGAIAEIVEFLEWYADLPYKHKILIAGNHDKGTDPRHPNYVGTFKFLTEHYGITYLEDSYTIIEGFKFHGSPVTPTFGYGWAWNRNEGGIKHHWDRIPGDTDVLITHGPSFGVLDTVNHNLESVGCFSLADKVEEVKPKYHIFGHIHEEYGVQEYKNTTYVNASICTLAYKPTNKPIVITLGEKDE